MEPLGLNFIKLGLQDVLYNPETKELFTPNTGITQNLDSGALLSKGEDGIIESRAWDPTKHPKNKDGKWKYTGGRKNKKSGKTKYAPTYSGKKPKGIRMNKKKYNELCGKVATNHPEWKNGSHVFSDSNWTYVLTVNDFGDYTFNRKWKNK